MIKDSIPKISCVTVTTGRVDLIKKAIHCYTYQTYKNKELVVLSQGEDDENNAIRQHIESLGRNDIVFLDAPNNLTLGAMRNASIEVARGSIICQWDDDDLYHPERIRTQYIALRNHSKNVGCAYSGFLKYFKNTGEVYWCDWMGEGTLSSQLLCGAVMFHKKIFHKYKNMLYPQTGDQCHVEEDLNVLQKLIAAGPVVPVSGSHHYVYVYHGKNTYDLEHHKLTLLTNSGKTIMDSSGLISNKELLEQTFSTMGVESPATFKSLTEDAFTYDPK
jgi:glycosyltransferase involved in cell wall biosynthesis